MKTTVSIPDAIFAAAEIAAKQLSMSRSRFYTTAIREYLRTLGPDDVTQRLNAVYAQEPSEVAPVLQAMQWQSLKRTPW